MMKYIVLIMNDFFLNNIQTINISILFLILIDLIEFKVCHDQLKKHLINNFYQC